MATEKSDMGLSLFWPVYMLRSALDLHCFQNETYSDEYKIMSRNMRFPTMWYVRPAKAQISLRIGAGWSEPLLVAWIIYEY